MPRNRAEGLERAQATTHQAEPDAFRPPSPDQIVEGLAIGPPYAIECNNKLLDVGSAGAQQICEDNDEWQISLH